MKKKERIAELETQLIWAKNGLTIMSRAWKVDRDMVTTLKAELAKFVKCDDGACKPEFEHEGITVYHKIEAPARTWGE